MVKKLIKTIKQKIELIIYQRFRQYQSENDEKIADRILKAFKEWLQQKHEEIKRDTNYYLDKIYYDRLFKKVLEELEQ